MNYAILAVIAFVAVIQIFILWYVIRVYDSHIVKEIKLVRPLTDIEKTIKEMERHGYKMATIILLSHSDLYEITFVRVR